MPFLQILERDRVVASYLLRGGRTLIGRSDRCDVALPGEEVSRTHCAVEPRDGAWWVVDRSRHGTQLDGVAVEEAPLGEGATLGIGPFQVRFATAPDEVADRTVTRMARPADHEALLDVGEATATQRVVLHVTEGPRAGHRIDLTRTRVRVGGPGSHVVLDDQLPAGALVLRVVRGRAMVEPGTRPVFVDGERVREILPVVEGEAIRLGDHVLTVRSAVVEETPAAWDAYGDLVGASDAMQRVYHVLDRVSRHDTTVMIVGETGTGKELAARAIHDGSPRHDGPFVAVNCAAIPEHLVESELFGHEAGAFTGASKRRDGAFHRAHGGTLLLDELGEMHLDVQAKLLRALESGEVHRVGGSSPEFPDVRVIAATHRNLAAMAEAGAFRRDLLYRLAVLTVPLPPLRTHKGDLPQLVHTLLTRHHPGAACSDAALETLAGHDWPGNVRELRNVLTRAVVLHGDRLEPAHLSFDPFAFADVDGGPVVTAEAAEKRRIEEALRQAGGNRAEAARRLGLARTSLLYKMRKHGLG